MIKTGRRKFWALLFVFSAFSAILWSMLFVMNFGCNLTNALVGTGFGFLVAFFVIGNMAVFIEPFEEHIYHYLEKGKSENAN